MSEGYFLVELVQTDLVDRGERQAAVVHDEEVELLLCAGLVHARESGHGAEVEEDLALVDQHAFVVRHFLLGLDHHLATAVLQVLRLEHIAEAAPAQQRDHAVPFRDELVFLHRCTRVTAEINNRMFSSIQDSIDQVQFDSTIDCEVDIIGNAGEGRKQVYCLLAGLPVASTADLEDEGLDERLTTMTTSEMMGYKKDYKSGKKTISELNISLKDSYTGNSLVLIVVSGKEANITKLDTFVCKNPLKAMACLVINTCGLKNNGDTITALEKIAYDQNMFVLVSDLSQISRKELAEKVMEMSYKLEFGRNY